MSADNWTICPVCHKKWKEPQTRYGKVSEEQYLASLAERPKEEPQTLREDWGIGIDETGEFDVDYRCSCSTCGFTYVFRQTTKADLACGVKK